MAQKEVELILLRQWASHLNMPIFLVDREGMLLYYNEPAEVLLGRSFDEAGEMPAADLSSLFETTDEDGSPIQSSDLPRHRADPETPGFPPHPLQGPRRSSASHRDRSVPSRWSGRALAGRRRHLLGGTRRVKITLWGTRGSLPEAGRPTLRYGGNTSCATVESRDGQLLVLDAGSGIRRFGAGLDPDIRQVDILLTHLHMDHIQGLGFFKPLYTPELRVNIWGPPSTTMHLRERLARYLSPPLFPVRIRDLPSLLTLHDAPRGEFRIGVFRIWADLICHPGPTVGYRISENGRSMAYMPDHEPVLGRERIEGPPDWISGYGLARGADLLIHDAQYTEAEYVEHIGWGHSTYDRR
jgi:ribonuclease BN (tRNA processing enzyme)